MTSYMDYRKRPRFAEKYRGVFLCAGQSLHWWVAYNNIKHGRVGNFSDANLKNTLNALAALYILEIYFLKSIADALGEMGIPDKPSSLFKLNDFETRYTSMEDISLEITDTIITT